MHPPKAKFSNQLSHGGGPRNGIRLICAKNRETATETLTFVPLHLVDMTPYLDPTMRYCIIFILLAVPKSAMTDTIVEDGPWIDVPAGAAFQTTALTHDDIIALADLDGDPSVVSADEKDMIALLVQMLGASPVSN